MALQTEEVALERVIRSDANKLETLSELVQDCLADSSNSVSAEILAWSTVHGALETLSLLQLLAVLIRNPNFKSSVARIVAIAWDKDIIPIDCIKHLEDSFKKFGSDAALDVIDKRAFVPSISTGKSEASAIKIDIMATKRTVAKNKASITKTQTIEDRTNRRRASLRKNVYYALMTSMSGEEGAHKVLKMQMKNSLTVEVILETAYRSRTYQPVYSEVADKLCSTNLNWQQMFENQFYDIYNEKSAEMEPGQLRNMGQLYAYLLANSLSNWRLFQVVILHPDFSTASQRILLQTMLVSLRSELGLKTLSDRLWNLGEETVANMFKADPEFSEAFFDSIGLSALSLANKK